MTKISPKLATKINTDKKIKTFTYEEAYEEAKVYFKGDELAANVWVDKYCLKNGDDYLEMDYYDTATRMFSEFLRIENKYPIVHTGVSTFYDANSIIQAPGSNEYLYEWRTTMNHLINPVLEGGS